MLNIIECIVKSICLNWHGKYLQRGMLNQSDLFLLSSSVWYHQQVLPLTPGGRMQWEGADMLYNVSGNKMRSAVYSRNSDYFLLCFTSTETADLFHSCGTQITHWPVSSQTLFGCRGWYNTSKWPPVLAWETQARHQKKKISMRKRVQHWDRLPRTSGKPPSLEVLKTWLDKVMADLIYSWW